VDAYAVVEEVAVVVESLDAPFTYSTMLRPKRPNNLTIRAHLTRVDLLQ